MKIRIVVNMQTGLEFEDDNFELPPEIDATDMEAVNEYAREYARNLDGGIFTEIEGDHSWDVTDVIVTEKWIVAFDTLCTGWDCVKNEDDEPFLHDSEAEALADIKADIELENIEEDEYFAIPLSKYEKGHKTIYTPTTKGNNHER